jgi:hypothetical protein
MLDLGRRYWSVEYLRSLLAELEWRRYNRLHLHLTDWNAVRVRVDDDRYRSVAAGQSYDIAELRELVEFGRDHHVEIVPEIDLPSHATAFVRVRPQLGFPAGETAMNSSDLPGAPRGQGWTVNVTRKENREWLAGFVAAVAEGTGCRTIHIGGDEWQDGKVLEASPTLSWYARCLDPSYFAVDGLLAFLEETRLLLAAVGRTTDRFPGNPGDDERNRVADARWLYESWAPRRHPLLLGYQLCVWADDAENTADDYFEWYSARPRQVLADRLWGGPRVGGIDDFADLVDRIGPSPVHPRRTSPAHVALARGPVLATGCRPLFAAAVRLAGLRYRPRPPAGGWVSAYQTGGTWSGPSRARLERLRGLRVQVRADGGEGWREAAELPLMPTTTWNQVPVSDAEDVTAARLIAQDGSAIDDLVDVRWLAREG